MKIHPVGAELFHADEWTDRDKKITRNCKQYSLAWVFLPFVHVKF